MHDIRTIRENPGAFDAAMARRGLAPLSDGLIQLDTIRRARLTMAEQAVAERNRLSAAIGPLMGRMKSASDADRPAIEAEIDALKARLGNKSEQERLEREADETSVDLDRQLAALPNAPDADVPDGLDQDPVHRILCLRTASAIQDRLDIAAVRRNQKRPADLLAARRIDRLDHPMHRRGAGA